MYKKLALLVLLFTGFAKAQNVTIPDPALKGLLVAASNLNDTANYQIIDTDANGEISETEALGITKLNLAASISDFSGLEAFVNLQELYISASTASTIPLDALSQLTTLSLTFNTNLSELNLSGATALELLQLSDNYALADLDLSMQANLNYLVLHTNTALTMLDVSPLVNLITLECSNNTNLTSINLGTISNLTTLICQQNELTSLNVSNLSNLISLDIRENPITNINLTGLSNLENLNCKNTNLTNLTLDSLVNLQVLDCSVTPLSALDVSMLTQLSSLKCDNTQIASLNLTNSPLMQSLNFSSTNIAAINLSMNAALTDLRFSDTGISAVNWAQHPSLGRIDCDDTNITLLDVSGLTNLNLLTCGGTSLERLLMKNGKNEIFTLLDSPNLEFICADEMQISNVLNLAALHAAAAAVSSYCSFTPGGDYNSIIGKIGFDQDNNGCDANDLALPFNLRINMTGAFASSTFLNQTGNYTLYTQTGNYTVTPAVEYPDFFTVTPASVDVNFPLLDNTESVQDFCITANGIHPDLEVVVAPIGSARPGFDANYKIIYRNKGNQVQSGQVNLSFDDAVLDLVSAAPAVDNQEPNLLSWNFSTLMPFETRSIDLTLNVNSPVEMPAVNNGDTLAYIAQITNSEGEETPSDNTFHYNQVVVNSFDPNDKACLEGSNVLPEFIGKFLHYNINFENTGTADAVNIVVRDVIDTTRFDINTLQVQYASHPVETKITGNVVEFIFENINLPPSIMNPIGGHGNVLFKIRTLPTLALNDEVANTANIFFDYNYPIATNEARTVFSLLTKNDFVKDHKVAVYPNPAKDKVSVKADSNIQSVQLYDLQGRILQTSIEGKKETTLDLSAQQTGVYFIRVTTEKGSATQKIIKE
jgi:uncharacterized repeat protein (TIGR01451 family)